MKCLTLIAAGAAIAGLTACTHAASPSASAARPSPTVTRTVSPAVCKQQYDSWKRGPGKGVVDSLTAIDSAAAAGSTTTLTAELRKTRPVLARAASYPVPVCADPNGYWTVLMMHVSAAVTGTGSASTLTAAMKGVPGITHKLVAELKRVDASSA
jgi:hypothetical protein